MQGEGTTKAEGGTARRGDEAGAAEEAEAVAAAEGERGCLAAQHPPIGAAAHGTAQRSQHHSHHRQGARQQGTAAAGSPFAPPHFQLAQTDAGQLAQSDPRGK